METSAALAQLPLDPPPGARARPRSLDPEQLFVTRLRAAARGFAAAAGAESAVVREAVPPARHRRSRCRVVMRWADGTESDLTFLGGTDRGAAADEVLRQVPARGIAPSAFDVAIEQWFTQGRPHDPSWLVVDDDSPGGIAVDVTAWLAR